MMTNNNSQTVQTSRKRRRNTDAKQTLRRRNSETTIVLICVLVGLVKCTVGQTSYYNSCFDQIRNADDNEDLLLSKEEYRKFLITISGGAVLLQNETPPTLSNPYTLRQNGISQQLNISGINAISTVEEQNKMVSFCQQIYSGLASIFGIVVEVKTCTDLLRMSDSDPQNNVLSTNEYAFFVVNISKDVSLINYDFEELPNTLKDAFDDMSVDGEIPESLGEEYLVRFCERVEIAAKIGEIVYATMPTDIPSETPITKRPVTPNIPSKAPVAKTPTPISNNPVTISEANAKCKSDLVVSDLNRNSLLEADEYGKFLEELSDKKVSGTDFANLDVVFQNSFTNLTNSNDGGINLSGFQPGRTPSSDEYESLVRICNKTQIALIKYESEGPDAYSPSVSPALNSNATKLSEIKLKTCKKFMVLSDANRNSALEESEFVKFVSRLTTTQDLSGYKFADLDASLRGIYEGKSRGVDGIDIDGSKPGQEPTPSEENNFRILCTMVYGAIEKIEADGPNTKMPLVVEISDDFFRVCKNAMVVADRNRDDILVADEYVRFLNRLTISEFSGKVFADLEPVLQRGFLNVATNGKVDVYGSKPGTTPSANETDHLRHVCESTNFAIEGYYDKTDSTGNQKSDCETKLLKADRNTNYEIDKSEYVVYLQSVTGFNYTKFEDLPYLLRDQYEWFRLGKNTVNIRSLENQSVSLQGDRVRISWICDRTSQSLELLSKLGKEKSFPDFCDAALKNADNNTDGLLDDDEFITLVDTFQVAEQRRYNLSAIDAAFLESFERFRDTELNLVDVKMAKANGLCEDVANATVISREREILFRICSDSLKLSDVDRNGRLNQTEYIPFIDTLVTAYNLSISASGDFEGLKSNDAGIDIRGLYTESSFDEYTTLREVCTTTGYAFGIIKNIGVFRVENITIYNSFLLFNEAGFKAEHLTPDSDERRGLENAYASFVDYEVQASLGSHGRFLFLRSAALAESKVYQIVDSPCPNVYETDETCQTAFASFNITVSSDDESLNNISSLLSNKTQDAIERGTLQLTLSTIDPNSTLKIIKSSQPLKPVEDEDGEFETIEEPNNEDSGTSSEGKNHTALAAIAGAAVGASIFGSALFFLFVSRQKKRKKTSTCKEVIDAESLNTAKPPCNFDDDNLLEEGRKPTARRFIFSGEHNEDDGTCGLSETNNSSFLNVSHKNPSAFKIDDNVEVAKRNVFDSSSSYVNPNLSFKISDDSESSVDSDRDVTDGEFGFRVDDNRNSTAELFPVNSFGETTNIPTPNTKSAHSEDGVKEHCVRENGTTDESIHTSICSDTYGLNLPDRNDDSDSFEEVEIESDDEIEENLVVAPGESSGKKNDDFDTSFSIEEYDDASDEEIEISVHEDEEDETIIDTEPKDENAETLPELTNDSQKDLDIDVDDDNVVMKKEVAVIEEEESEEEEEEESESDDEVEVSESEEEDEDEASDSDDEDEASNSVDTSQASDADEQEDFSDNSDGAEALTNSYQKYRPVIEELIRQVMPDEIDNIDVMMEQFIGNEKELVTSLRNMAGIDDTDDDKSGSDDSDSTSTETDDTSIAKAEKSSSEEGESDDDVDVDESDNEESDESDSDAEESEEEDDDADEESESSEEKSKGVSQSESDETDGDDSSEYESD